MSQQEKNKKEAANSPPKNIPLIKDDEVFLRMNLAERIQHFILIITFFILIITGLPLIFFKAKSLKFLFSLQQSFYTRGIIHRIAASIFILNFIWHIIYTIFTPRGRENFKEMVPKFKDFKDALELFWHNLGFTRFLYRRGIFKSFFGFHPYWLFNEPPKFARFSFIEKFEYWAVGSGAMIMILSGFFMWNIKLSFSIFPLWIHNIFIIIHSYEAILAFSAIIIWHMYNVHFNPEAFPMSKVWLTGKITGKELRTHHPLEYKKILEERQKELSRQKE